MDCGFLSWVLRCKWALIWARLGGRIFPLRRLVLLPHPTPQPLWASSQDGQVVLGSLPPLRRLFENAWWKEEWGRTPRGNKIHANYHLSRVYLCRAEAGLLFTGDSPSSRELRTFRVPCVPVLLLLGSPCPPRGGGGLGTLVSTVEKRAHTGRVLSART